MGTIDLHMHSDLSLDGQFTPKELVTLCMDSGIRIGALSDHNSVGGVSEMKTLGKAAGIHIVSAVELDCIYKSLDLHLLGYGIDVTDKRYGDLEHAILKEKRESSRKRMDILHELGICFEEQAVMKLAKHGIVVGEMIAEAALADERNQNNPLIQPYLDGGDRSDNPYVNFFWDYCSQGKTAFIPVAYMDFEEAVSLIEQTGGIAVLAHPGQTVKKDEAAVRAMIGSGVKGIEVYCSYHNKETAAYYSDLADVCHVIKTMGSDFHGKTKPSVHLGSTGGEDAENLLEQSFKELGLI